MRFFDEMTFDERWLRIKKETNINNFTMLAKVVKTTHQYVSKKKKDDDFPVKWAYSVAEKYNLSTDWIMTGRGPKKINQEDTRGQTENDFLHLVDEWLQELTKAKPQRAEWFQLQFEDSFPSFKKWYEKKETKWRREDSTDLESKVA